MTYRGHKGAALRDAKLLALLSECAEKGQIAPTNADLMDVLGLERENSVSRTIKRLEARGALTIQRFTNSRIITIVSTGKSTGGVAGGIHWTHADEAAPADDQPQSDAAPVARAQPHRLPALAPRRPPHRVRPRFSSFR